MITLAASEPPPTPHRDPARSVDSKMQTRISKHIAIVGGVVGLVGLIWMGVKEAS